jgi:hypothetical protein
MFNRLEAHMIHRVKFLPAVALVALLSVPALAAVTWGSPASGVAPSLLSRATFPDFKVRSYPQGPGDFKAEAKEPTDILVRRHTYQPHSHTGWHSHPGPVFVTVTKGTLTFYEYADGKCTPKQVSAGGGYVDTGRGHIARNESDEPAEDISVIIAPVGGSFRSELDAPAPNCDF